MHTAQVRAGLVCGDTAEARARVMHICTSRTRAGMACGCISEDG